MRAPRLKLVVIRSADIEKAAELYGSLGLQFERHAHGGGVEHYASQQRGVVFEIYPLRSDQTPTTSTRLGFGVDDLDDTIAAAVAAGARVLEPAAESPWGRRAVLRDFDGHRIELIADEPGDDVDS